MKILTIEQVREADAYTIAHEPISSINLMERAATACTDWFTTNLLPEINQHIHIFCGLGNNGGDGLAIARLMAAKNFIVVVYIVRYKNTCSEDFLINERRLNKIPSVAIINLKSETDVNALQFKKGDVVIDAIVGSGLNKPIEGLVAKTIEAINKFSVNVFSIDIPSGLSAIPSIHINKQGVVIKATHTLTFQIPKLVFMFPQHGEYIGDFTLLDIGLDNSFINQQSTINYFTTLADVRIIIKPRGKFSHKGTYGHALIISGSYGKMGAAQLTSRACLRSGAGLVTVHLPKCGYEIMQTSLPEAMVSIDSDIHFISALPKLDKYTAIGIGPGIDTEKQTQNVLKLLIQNCAVPLVLDADALNILSENKTWLSFLPKGTVLTPHPKEFERLAGKTENDYERYGLLRDFAFKFGVYVVLKGAHTAVACPDGTVYFNSTGNPGMATAGSGDVLTGIITGLLAQGFSPKEAALLAVFWHGLAADIAMDTSGSLSVIAGDIISAMAKAFKIMIK
ncbi:MAG: NAD(P)H-hydrate dehydratase [Bacteroidia bacterium]|nr:NAD(P)H-hydrate dehydratase [Bacteroidia bacterium]